MQSTPRCTRSTRCAVVRSISYFSFLRPLPLKQIHAELKAEFLTGKSRDVAYRKQQLLQLTYMLHDNIARFDAALTADLGRSTFENNLCVPRLAVLYIVKTCAKLTAARIFQPGTRRLLPRSARCVQECSQMGKTREGPYVLQLGSYTSNDPQGSERGCSHHQVRV
jgi:hypothetical protein